MTDWPRLKNRDGAPSNNCAVRRPNSTEPFTEIQISLSLPPPLALAFSPSIPPSLALNQAPSL
jgi:hypothetical protein